MVKIFKNKERRFNIDSKNGFTIIEAFVALGLLLLISASILTTIITANRMVNRTSYRVMALNFGRQSLEEIRNRGFDSLLAMGSLISYEYELPDGKFKDDLSGQRQYKIESQTWGAEICDYKVITVQVSWVDPYSGNTKTEEFLVYLADRVTVL